MVNLFSQSWVWWLLLVICGLINLTGFFGLFLIFFPGLTVSWIGQVIWLIYVGFNHSHSKTAFILTIVLFVINTIIMLVGSFLDNILGAKETRSVGVPWWEILLTWLAMMIGSIFITPIGGLALALGVLFLVESKRLNLDYKAAWESTKALMVGYGSAALLRILLCAIMIFLWEVMVFLL